ncbi:co-regulatory protein PtrA N-terminal domain-containing protein [Pseudomonas sp. GL-B-19]|uniref:co-regulatory protein PtrA N-terminal domain-containing protein n=1 Tax=Pseudomonas sp. GL-B-19 TaxID=2832393 RepID=UPI001CBAD653|nr:co-regulatory protein PtrA N-terminal domain-containing protein [Pseudomonas sp. GL-B-19]
MKSMKALFVFAALTAASLAMATGGGDKTFNRMEAARKVSMEAYQVAQKQKAEAAVAQSKAKAADHSNS